MTLRAGSPSLSAVALAKVDSSPLRLSCLSPRKCAGLTLRVFTNVARLGGRYSIPERLQTCLFAGFHDRVARLVVHVREKLVKLILEFMYVTH